MKAATDRPRPSWASRVLAVACYVGLAPLLQLLRRGRSDVFFSHHRNQALTTLLLLFVVLLAYPIAESFEIYFVRHYFGQPPNFMIAFCPGLGIGGVLSLLGVGMALAGSTRPVPRWPAVPDWFEALTRGDVSIRGGVVIALGRIGPDAKAAVPALIEVFKCNQGVVRDNAAEALKKIDPEAAKQAEVE